MRLRVGARSIEIVIPKPTPSNGMKAVKAKPAAKNVPIAPIELQDDPQKPGTLAVRVRSPRKRDKMKDEFDKNSKEKPAVGVVSQERYQRMLRKAERAEKAADASDSWMSPKQFSKHLGSLKEPTQKK